MKFASTLQHRLRVSFKLILTGILIGGISSPDITQAAGEKSHTIKHTFTYDYNDLSIVQQGEYDIVTLKDAPLSEDEVGAPALPVVYANILVPAGSKVSEVTAVATKEVKVAEGLLVQPTQPAAPLEEGPKPAFVGPNAVAYQKATKRELINSKKAENARGMTIVPVQLHPVRVVPASGELYLAEEIEVTITVDKPPRRLQAKGGKNFDEFSNAVKSSVVNPDEPEGAPLSTTGGSTDTTSTESTEESAMAMAAGDCDYLIITSNALLPTFQTLANHRTSAKGLSSEVISVESIYATYTGLDNQMKIRNCIKDYVANHGTLYVVLGGDSVVVPVRNCPVVCGSYSASMPTDFYYAGLDGTWDSDGDKIYGELTDGADLLADVWLGRIPIQTAAQASAYINKLRSYELATPTSITRKYLTGGRYLWSTYATTARPTDVLNDGHAQFTAANHPKVSDTEIWQRRLFRDNVQKHGYTPSRIGVLADTCTSWDSVTCGDYAASASNMVTRLSEGWNFTLWVAHGSTGGMSMDGSTFNTVNAANLTGLTTIFYTGSCHTGRFTTEPCLSEAMLRNPNGGAIVYIGCSHYNWGGTYLAFQQKFCDVVFRDQVKNAAQAFYNHKAAFIASAGSNNSIRWDTFGINYQGDPAFTIVGAELGAAANVAPVASNDAYSTATGVALSVSAANGVLKNDSDTNGDMLTATLVSSPASGTLSLSSTGGFTYTPAAGFTGTVSFTYKAKDAALFSNIATVTITVSAATNTAPTVAIAAKATPSLVTAKTTVLSVLGADTAGEANLVYTWAATGPAAVSFSANGSNAAKNTTATFNKAGSYGFTVTIKDAGNLTVTSSANVTVSQTVTTVAVSPATASVVVGQNQSFTASANDQFGSSMTSAFTWAVSGGGSISSAGLFTAGSAAGGPFTVTASSGGKSATASVTVTASTVVKPVVRIKTSANAVEPAAGGRFQFSLPNGAIATPLTVNYTVAGTAAAGTDYTALSGSVVIPAGTMSVSVTVTPKEDSIIEGQETVVAQITTSTAYTLYSSGMATLYIHDDEKPTITLGAADATLAEPSDKAQLKFVATPAPKANLTVNYTMSGTAVSGTDYVAPSGSIVIMAGTTTSYVDITPKDDTLVEGKETVIARVSASTSYVGTPAETLSLYDNELPIVNVTATDKICSETGPDSGTFTLTRTGSTAASLTVTYNMMGSAVNGTDYNMLSGSATIPAGSTTATVTFTPTNDSLVEGSESVQLRTAGSATYQIGAQYVGTVNIADND
jgi:hypothetical protein